MTTTDVIVKWLSMRLNRRLIMAHNRNQSL